MGFEEMMAELRKEYVASLPEKLKTISEHWQAGSLEELRNDFHKLKGTGKTYGLPEVSDLGLIMEKLCRTSPNQLKAALPVALLALQRIYDLRNQSKEVTGDLVKELTELRKFETP